MYDIKYPGLAAGGASKVIIGHSIEALRYSLAYHHLMLIRFVKQGERCLSLTLSQYLFFVSRASRLQCI